MMAAHCTNFDDSDVDPFQDIDDASPVLSEQCDVAYLAGDVPTSATTGLPATSGAPSASASLS
eukprot:7149276-Pyramimonas_sp.AAC.1